MLPMGEKTVAPDKKLKLGYWIAAAVLFCNPLFNLIDILPDFIGCALMLASLARIRDLSEHVASARKRFLILFWVSLSKIPAFVWMFSIFSSHPTERTIMLLFTFVYAVAESILFALSFRDLPRPEVMDPPGKGREATKTSPSPRSGRRRSSPSF